MPLVKFYAQLRQIAGQQAFVPAGNLRAVLDAVCSKSPALRNALFDGDRLREQVRVMVNGHDIELGQGLDTVLHEQDQLAIFPPIGGGA